MNMTEASRMIEGLYREGWDANKICKFILWVEKGDERIWETPAKDPDQDYQMIRDAVYYQFRKLVKKSDKQTYTKEELLDFIDAASEAKDQERS